MWPAAPPTSAPLMQPLASAVTVCAVSRSAAVTAANTNFMRILPTRTIPQRDPPERGSDQPDDHFLCLGFRQNEIGQFSYRAQQSSGRRPLSISGFSESAWL